MEKIIELLIAFLGGATLSAVVTYNVTKTMINNRNSTVQSGNTVGGDIVGRDKTRK